MIQSFGTLTLLARNVDEAIEFYTGTLGFEVQVDHPFGEGQRWVTLALPTERTLEITVCSAGEADEQSVGRQAGTYPWITLLTNNFHEDYERLLNKGVRFVGEPHTEMWGTGVLFQDLYGNRVYLLEHADMTTGITDPAKEPQ